MKKLFTLLLGLGTLFAAYAAPQVIPAPTASDLSDAGYDVTNNVVLCVNFTGDATVCDDIYFIGTFNKWELSNRSYPFEPLKGFDGWYVAQASYGSDFQGKPIHVDKNGDLLWKYQPGDLGAWTHIGGKQADIINGFTGEADVYFYNPGAYIYEISYWKNHADPCAPPKTHNYEIRIYPPECEIDYAVAIGGEFNNWNQTEPMTKNTSGYYVYTVEGYEGDGVSFYQADNGWDNPIQYYDIDDDNWYSYQPSLPESDEANPVWTIDLRNNSNYRWKQCPQTFNVDLGNQVSWYYWQPSNYWCLYGFNADYELTLSIKSSTIIGSASSDDGTIILDGTWLHIKSADSYPSISSATATVIPGTQIQLNATLTTNTGDVYVVTAAIDLPTAKSTAQISMNGIASYYDYYNRLYAGTDDYAIDIYTFGNTTGTFTVNENAIVTISPTGYGAIYAHSGSITVTEVDGKWNVTGTVLGANSVQYNIASNTLPEPTCWYTLQMTDSYGDGWNGGYLRVSDGDFSIRYTLMGGSYLENRIPYYGKETTFEWMPGGWVDEVGFVIIASNGMGLFQHQDHTDLSSGLIYTLSDSPCSSGANPYEPKNVQASLTSEDKISVSWDAVEGASYYRMNIYSPLGTDIAGGDVVSSTSYLSNMLRSSGDYTIMVTSLNDSYMQLGQATTTVKNVVLPNIESANIRIMVPSDCNFNLPYGMYMYWRPSETSDWDYVTMTQNANNARVFETTISPNAPAYDFYFSNFDDGRTYWYYSKDPSPCFEMRYKESDYYYYYDFWYSNCEFKDHNYTISNPQATSYPGHVDFSWDAVDIAQETYIYLYDANTGNLLEEIPVSNAKSYSWTVPDEYDGREVTWGIQVNSPYRLGFIRVSSPTLVLQKAGTPAEPTHDYTVTLYAPTACDELPGIIGDFNTWEQPIAMTPSFDYEKMKVKYTATITMEEGKGFKIVAMPVGAWDATTGWQNQMSYFDGKDWVWMDEYIVGSDTEITLPWSDCRQYRFYQCTNSLPSKKVVIGAYLPDGVPALGAEVIGTFNNWRGKSEPAVVFAPVPNMSGLYYAVVDEAVATDYFKIRQLDNWDNEILCYDESYTDNNHWRRINDEEWTFGNMWLDAEMVGNVFSDLAPYTSLVDKGILLTINNPAQYKWTKVPQTINIDCGENFIWKYYATDDDWYIEVENSEYYVTMDFYQQDKDLPVGTYETKDFLLRYTHVNNAATINIAQANAVVKVTDGIISVIATLVGTDGNIYKITAAREVPTVKQQVTITATNLTFNSKISYIYTAGNADYSVEIEYYPNNISTDPYTGTFVIGPQDVNISVKQGTMRTSAVSGSITVEGDKDGKLTLKGKALCYNNVEYTFDFANFEPALGATTLRILVPSDNNMNIDDGVFVWWWYDNLVSQCVQAQSIGGRWFEAQLNVADDSHFNFLVVNANVGADSKLWDAATTQKTYDVIGVAVTSACYEMSYNNFIKDKDGYAFWTLYEVDCAHQNHDYRFTAEFDNTSEGRLMIEITANQLAPHYELKYRLKGSTGDWFYANWDSNGYSTLNKAFDITSDIEYEYEFTAFEISSVTNYGYYVTEQKKGDIMIYANTNIPENLQTALDGVNVTFTWQPKGDETEYYVLIVYDKDGNPIFESDHILGTSYSTAFYMNADYYWILRAYDDIDNIVANPQGPKFSVTNAPNLKATNMDVKTEGRIATLTWEEPSPADKALLVVYQADPMKVEVKTVLAGNDGKFSYTFTFDENDKRTLNWSVYSLITGHDYYQSDIATGQSFKAEIPTYKLEISAGEGGKVNDEVNGTYEENTIVTLVATPNVGYEFSKWSDQNDEPTRIFKITKDVKLVASFKKIGGGGGSATTYTLSIASAGGGKVNETVNGTYEENDAVTLVATPNSGWTFDKWSDGNQEETRIITMDKNYTLTAYFKTTQKFKVTISAGSGGKVEPSGITDKEYTGGTSLEITAKPNSDYTFVKWSDGNTQAKRTIVITQDTVLKATFEEVEKATLRVEIMPDDAAGTVLFDDEKISPLRQEVTVGSTITLKAKPASGYVFVQFEDGSTTVTSTEYEVTVNKTKTVYAVFKKEEQGLNDISDQAAEVKKIIRNGEVYILRGDKIYTVQGQIVQ